MHAPVPLALDDEGYFGVLGIGLLCIFMAVFLFLMRDRERACGPATRDVSFARTRTHRATSSTSQHRTPSAARQGPPSSRQGSSASTSNSRQGSPPSTSNSDRIPVSRSTSVRTVHWSAGPQASSIRPTALAPFHPTALDTFQVSCPAISTSSPLARESSLAETCESWDCGRTSRNLISEEQRPDSPLTQLSALKEEHAAQLRAVKVEQEAMRKELLLRVSVLERMIMSHGTYNLSPCSGPKDPGPIPPLEPSTPLASLRPSGLSQSTSLASQRVAANKGKKPSSGTLFYSQVVNSHINGNKHFSVAMDRAMRERAASLPTFPIGN